MSRQIETVQAIYAAFGKGDVPGILAHLDPDVDWEHDWGGEPLRWYRPRRGRAAVPGFFEALADFEFLRFEPIAFLEGAGMVCVPIHLELKVKANGKVIRDLEAHLWSFGADGAVKRFRHLCDTAQFAAATEAQRRS
jgi:ketosteroid isomerase-like protein